MAYDKFLYAVCLSSAFCSSMAAPHGANDVNFLKKMREYWKEGDTTTAKRQAQQFLETEGSSALAEEVHLFLGDLYLKEGNFETALAEYDLIEREELRDKIFYNRALCCYETKQVEELLLIGDTFAKKNLTSSQKHSIGYFCAQRVFESLTSSTEKDPAVIQKTVSLFEGCKGTEFEPFSFYPLAKLYEMQGDKQRAASYYVAAGEAHPERSGDLFFQAAVLQSELLPDIAIENFEKVLTSSSSHKSAALYNCLTLQFKEKQYKQLIACYERHRMLVSDVAFASVMHLVGESLYRIGNYEQAPDFLMKSLKEGSHDVQKASQLMILECAHKTKNIDLYEKVFRSGKHSLAGDAAYTSAHLGYLDLLKDFNKMAEFVEEAQAFLSINETHPEKERILWETAHSLYAVKDWKAAEMFLTQLTEQYPRSLFISNAYRLKMNCALCLFETNEELYRKDLIVAMQDLLSHPGTLNGEEQELFSFELAKHLFLDKQLSSAIIQIDLTEQLYPNTKFLRDLSLIRTLCYLGSPDSKDLFVMHAEKLLEDKQPLTESSKLRLHLFNTYVKMAEDLPAIDRQHLFAKAADHLFNVFENTQFPLKKENLEWLAQHYYVQSKQHPETYQDRAIVLFEALLGDHFDEHHLFCLSDLLSSKGAIEKKVAILSRFLNTTSPDQSSLQKQMTLELANCFHKLGEHLKALDLYGFLIESYPESSIKAHAILDRSKLLLAYLPENQKNEENPSFVRNLQDLKDLEVQRDLSSEPLHLEAGLEYINCKALLGKEKAKLLALFKENFQQECDEEGLEEKKLIVRSYLDFVDSQIALLEASSEEEQSSALDKISILLEDSSLRPELKKRIEGVLKESRSYDASGE